MEWIVEIPSHMIVKDFVSILQTQFEDGNKGIYLFELKSNRFLDPNLSFFENQIQSGDYLYFI